MPDKIVVKFCKWITAKEEYFPSNEEIYGDASDIYCLLFGDDGF